MDTITEHGMANFISSRGGIGCLHRFMTIEENIEEFKKCDSKVFVSIGCNEQELQRASALAEMGAEYFCLDVAHAHAKYVGRTLKRLRDMLPNACLMAGNVATYAGADFLASKGADIIKVGIGGGSVCVTRVKTGFGVPMLTSLMDCSPVDRSIVADGGIRTPGDVVKALAFGADYVMMGGMLAGTGPTPGPVVEREDGKKVKEYRGMASREAQEAFMGEMPKWKTSEGVSTDVPYREGAEVAILDDIIGGLRSGLTYGGSKNIRELQRKLNYTIVSGSGRIEGLPHKTM